MSKLRKPNPTRLIRLISKFTASVEPLLARPVEVGEQLGRSIGVSTGSRVGVFRLNIAVGRDTFEEVLGYPPATDAEHHADVDDATQGWVRILNPSDGSSTQVWSLPTQAHSRAIDRHGPRH